jgi:hypothetical protein
MKRILATCLLAILCASQANAETFRSSSDNQPRFKADTAPAAQPKSLRDSGCKSFKEISTTTDDHGYYITGICEDGSVWFNYRGTNWWNGWRKVPMDVYPEGTESE